MSKENTLRDVLGKKTWLLPAILAGLLLMNLGSGGRTDRAETVTTTYEQRLSGALSRMEGVGEVYVLLSEKQGREGGFSGAVVICSGGGDPEVRLRVTLAVQAFTALGSDKIIVQKMVS